jgi:Arc/MetJ-type ribon-helix-helix transcriptional regulator
MFKAPPGTKARLRRINPNVSELIREAVEEVLQNSGEGSAYEKAERLCGACKGGPRNGSTAKDYLTQYAPKGAR